MPPRPFSNALSTLTLKDAYILGKYGEFLLYRSECERGFDFLERGDKVANVRGYRSFDEFRNSILFYCGGLDMTP